MCFDGFFIRWLNSSSEKTEITSSSDNNLQERSPTCHSYTLNTQLDGPTAVVFKIYEAGIILKEIVPVVGR